MFPVTEHFEDSNAAFFESLAHFCNFRIVFNQNLPQSYVLLSCVVELDDEFLVHRFEFADLKPFVVRRLAGFCDVLIVGNQVFEFEETLELANVLRQVLKFLELVPDTVEVTSMVVHEVDEGDDQVRVRRVSS